MTARLISTLHALSVCFFHIVLSFLSFAFSSFNSTLSFLLFYISFSSSQRHPSSYFFTFSTIYSLCGNFCLFSPHAWRFVSPWRSFLPSKFILLSSIKLKCLPQIILLFPVSSSLFLINSVLSHLSHPIYILLDFLCQLFLLLSDWGNHL